MSMMIITSLKWKKWIVVVVRVVVVVVAL